MDIVLGASGQVGSMIVQTLRKQGRSVKAVVRDPSKQEKLLNQGARVAVADLKDEKSLCAALSGGENLFVLTPENLQEADLLLGVQEMIQNIREAAMESGIRKIVALSSFGAQHSQGTGTLQMSHELENSFEDLGICLMFLRPAYYYSNWMPSLDEIRQTGTLKSFFPADLQIPMVAPCDVAACAARLMTESAEGRHTYEIQGPFTYSPRDVADAFECFLGTNLDVEEIPSSKWPEILEALGMSPSALWNFIEMTEAVIDGKTAREGGEVCLLQGDTTFEEFLLDNLPRPIQTREILSERSF